jgi:hypothetical protein
MRLHQAAVRSFEGMESVPDVMMVVEMSAEASGSPSEARILRCQILGVLFTGTFWLCSLSLATHNKTGIGRPETEGFRKHADKHFFWHTQQFYFDDRGTPHISHGNQAISTPNDTRDPGMAFTLPPVVRFTY